MTVSANKQQHPLRKWIGFFLLTALGIVIASYLIKNVSPQVFTLTSTDETWEFSVEQDGSYFFEQEKPTLTDSEGVFDFSLKKTDGARENMSLVIASSASGTKSFVRAEKEVSEDSLEQEKTNRSVSGNINDLAMRNVRTLTRIRGGGNPPVYLEKNNPQDITRLKGYYGTLEIDIKGNYSYTLSDTLPESEAKELFVYSYKANGTTGKAPLTFKIFPSREGGEFTVMMASLEGSLGLPEGVHVTGVFYDGGLGDADLSAAGLTWYTIVPVLFVIITAFWTRQIIPPYIIGGFMAHYMVYEFDFFTSYFTMLYDTVMGDSYIWLVLVCGLMSSLMAMISRVGGTYAFSNLIGRYVKTGKGALMGTWLTGLILFVDDYLSCLAIGPSFSRITDKYKISREKFAFVVDSVAAAPCVLVPISTWAVFIAGLYEINGYAAEGEGLGVFVKTIPYNLYAWIVILMVPLVIYKILPDIGPMKKAEQRVKTTGQVAPPGSEKIEMISEDVTTLPQKTSALNLLLPLVVLVGATIYFDKDLFMGGLVAVFFTTAMILFQRILTVEELVECFVDGFKNMMFLFVLVALSYSFTGSLSLIGFAEYVVENIQDFMSPQLIPFILFLVFATTEFMTGSNWDIYMITFPIIIPLSLAIGADPILATAAVLSAGVLGSHACLVSDATLCTSASTGCENHAHTITQIPYVLIAAFLSATGFLILGFM